MREKVIYKFCENCNTNTLQRITYGKNSWICDNCKSEIPINNQKHGFVIISSYTDEFGIHYKPYIRNKEYEKF